ncbi:MAG: DUF3783 domain-containing protein [Clostridia bacterium]|nr:DUF3783 domain-containing protein [Clostridia bacterium]
MAKVLLFNFTDEGRRKKVKAALFRNGIPSQEVPPERQGETIGALLGLAGFAEGEKGEEAPFQEEMIVMHGLAPRQFNGFLDGLKQNGTRVALKAVVTEHNVNWSAARLYRELAEEHAAMTQGTGAPAHRQE